MRSEHLNEDKFEKKIFSEEKIVHHFEFRTSHFELFMIQNIKNMGL